MKLVSVGIMDHRANNGQLVTNGLDVNEPRAIITPRVNHTMNDIFYLNLRHYTIALVLQN
jgi:hypothetical protein